MEDRASQLSGGNTARPITAPIAAGASAAVEAAYRADYGRILATLIRIFRDFDLAEEALQDAFARALQRWPRDGVPDNPGGWITTAARHHGIDRIRRERVRLEKYA